MNTEKTLKESPLPGNAPAAETPDIETSSEEYAARFKGPAGEWMLRTQERAMLHLLSAHLKRGDSILEVGGGHGQLTGALIGKGWRVTVVGSDASCRRWIEPWLGDNCKFETGNLLSLPYSDQSFDAVVSIRLLPHIEQWPLLIRELTRVARQTVAVDYPTRRSANVLTPLLFGAKKMLEGNTRTYLLFDEAELVGHFRDQGFDAHGRFAEFLMPMVIHRMLKSPPLSAGLEALFRALQLTRWFGSPVIGRFDRRPTR